MAEYLVQLAAQFPELATQFWQQLLFLKRQFNNLSPQMKTNVVWFLTTLHQYMLAVFTFLINLYPRLLSFGDRPWQSYRVPPALISTLISSWSLFWFPVQVQQTVIDKENNQLSQIGHGHANPSSHGEILNRKDNPSSHGQILNRKDNQSSHGLDTLKEKRPVIYMGKQHALDTWFLTCAIYRETGRWPRFLCHPLHFKIIGWKQWVQFMGGVPDEPSMLKALMENQVDILYTGPLTMDEERLIQSHMPTYDLMALVNLGMNEMMQPITTLNFQSRSFPILFPHSYQRQYLSLLPVNDVPAFYAQLPRLIQETVDRQQADERRYLLQSLAFIGRGLHYHLFDRQGVVVKSALLVVNVSKTGAARLFQYAADKLKDE